MTDLYYYFSTLAAGLSFTFMKENEPVPVRMQPGWRAPANQYARQTCLSVDRIHLSSRFVVKHFFTSGTSSLATAMKQSSKQFPYKTHE
ncbi:MAG: hypothetical protein GY777_30875 [Candidatus Brocadiaceae bacterium]|nr:hypothetical protein [Candidatus Brocadiaceae bacterium]